MKSHAPTSAERALPCPFCGMSKNHSEDCYFTVHAQFGNAAEADLSLLPDLHDAWNRRAAMQTAEPANIKAIAKAAFDQVITDSCEDGDAQTNEDFYSGKVAGILAMKMAVEQSLAAPDRAPSIAPTASEVACSDCGLTMDESRHLASRRGTAPSIDSAADAKDAARYRFLRHADLDALAAQYWGNGEVYEGVQLDVALDEAIAALQPEGVSHGK